MNDNLIKLDVPLEIQEDLDTLFKHARGDTGGSRRCAMFLLSLWNGDTFKADLQALLYTDAGIFRPMIRIMQYLYGTNQQLESIVPEGRIKPILELWGNDLKTMGES